MGVTNELSHRTETHQVPHSQVRCIHVPAQALGANSCRPGCKRANTKGHQSQSKYWPLHNSRTARIHTRYTRRTEGHQAAHGSFQSRPWADGVPSRGQHFGSSLGAKQHKIKLHESVQRAQRRQLVIQSPAERADGDEAHRCRQALLLRCPLRQQNTLRQVGRVLCNDWY